MRIPLIDIVPQARNTYTGIEKLLYRSDGRWVHGRKVNHNTFLERRGNVRGIALKLHQTDVLLWRADNTVELNSGGWLTTTTRTRMNDWLPLDIGNGRFVHIDTVKGYWVANFGDHFGSGLPELSDAPFHDGMIIDMTTLTEFTPRYDDGPDRDWNARVDAVVEDWLARLTTLLVSGIQIQRGGGDREEIRRNLSGVLGLDLTSGDTDGSFSYPAWLVTVIRETGIRRSVNSYTQANLSPAVLRLLRDDLRKLFRGYLYRGYHSRRLK